MTDVESMKGVLKSVYHGHHDFTLSTWNHFLHRDRFFDHTFSMVRKERSSFINMDAPTMDFTLFIRPFKVSSWAGIVATLALSLTFTTISKLALEKGHHGPSFLSTESSKILLFFLSLFFVLVHAFYSGALIMFLSAPRYFPFTNYLEGLKEYPTWDMIAVDGTTAQFVVTASATGDKHLVKWLERVDRDKAAFLMPTFNDALERLVNEPGLFFSSGSIELSHFIHNAHVRKGLALQKLGKGRVTCCK